jgi:outer membrane protein assembly factor BamD (BamD/ComL family)
MQTANFDSGSPNPIPRDQFSSAMIRPRSRSADSPKSRVGGAISRILGRSCVWLWWGLVLSTPPLLGQNLGKEVDLAAQASAEGVPEVAVTRLRALLKNDLPGPDWRKVAAKLVEALLRAHEPGEALKLLEDRRLGAGGSTMFWRAQALAELHRWSEALPLYAAIATDEASPLHNEATFGTAEMLRALGRTDEALQRLTTLIGDKGWKTRARLRAAELFLDKSDTDNARRLLDEVNPRASTERKQRRFLRARLELIQHHPERAIGTFESLVKRPEGVSHPVVLTALFGIADAHLQLKTPESADDFLEDFIEHHPHDEDLSKIFAKLDELYRAERKPVRVELEKWTREHEQPRRAFALWYLARIELRAGHRERALQLFSNLRNCDQKPAALAGGLLEFAKLQLEEGRYSEGLQILEEARSLQPQPELLDRIDLTAAEAQYNSRRFESAAAAFERIARSASPFANTSMWNASLAWLKLGDNARFVADYNELQTRNADEASRAELRLEEGLAQAAKGDVNAAATLQAFLRDFPNHPRASEAWVALAELAFHATPPRLEEARRNLARANEPKPTNAATERSHYLIIWTEEAAGENDTRVVDLAQRFLKQHPGSKFASDVRMKLAEAYYRRQDFANSQTQFEILAQQNPSGPLAEKALLLAAQSAVSAMGPHSLDHAIVLFDRVVQLKGELRWAARNEQAVIERKLGKPQEALVLYDEVLKGDAKPAEKREALCGKGDIFFDMGAEDGKNYKRAIEAYDQLAAATSDSGHWRNQALFKKGTCLEKTANQDRALATFYQVLEDQVRPNRSPEFFWFYRAGFNAARLLEDQGKWESAAAVYEKLAAAGGARSDEAKARLSRLRLEHFLWKN